jgi:hypothetical protein
VGSATTVPATGLQSWKPPRQAMADEARVSMTVRVATVPTL